MNSSSFSMASQRNHQDTQNQLLATHNKLSDGLAIDGPPLKIWIRVMGDITIVMGFVNQLVIGGARL